MLELGEDALGLFVGVRAASLNQQYGLGLIFGFLTRIPALGIGVDMVGAILMVHLRNGFFMNWAGNQKGPG